MGNSCSAGSGGTTEKRKTSKKSAGNNKGNSKPASSKKKKGGISTRITDDNAAVTNPLASTPKGDNQRTKNPHVFEQAQDEKVSLEPPNSSPTLNSNPSVGYHRTSNPQNGGGAPLPSPGNSVGDGSGVHVVASSASSAKNQPGSQGLPSKSFLDDDMEDDDARRFSQASGAESDDWSRRVSHDDVVAMSESSLSTSNDTNNIVTVTKVVASSQKAAPVKRDPAKEAKMLKRRIKALKEWLISLPTGGYEPIQEILILEAAHTDSSWNDDVERRFSKID